jgi:hypothetical protein
MAAWRQSLLHALLKLEVIRKALKDSARARHNPF